MKNLNSTISFSLVLSLVFALLYLHMGLGLVVGLVLYTIGKKANHFFNRKIASKYALMGTYLTILLSISILITGLILIGKYGFHTYKEQSNLLLEYVINILKDIKIYLPESLSFYIPDTSDKLIKTVSDFTKSISHNVLSMGGTSIVILFQLLFALLISLNCSTSFKEPKTEFLKKLHHQYSNYTICFSKLMGAQLYVACWNALCTTIFIYLILPLLGVTLSFREILVVFTLIISLIPALGNMIANTIMAILCLPHGAMILVSAVIFLILVHKAEYLINAKIIGKTVEASVSEMLIAILIGERLFGLPGLMLGPVTYAYIKMYLKELDLI